MHSLRTCSKVKNIAIVLALILLSNRAEAQSEVLFKIVTWSDGVTIGGMTPAVGLNVSDPQQQIEIPAKGYLGVITPAGEVVRVTMSMSAGAVEPPRENKNRLSATGAVTGRIAPAINIYPEAGLEESLVSVDSLFISWEPVRPVEDTATIMITDMFDEEIIKLKTVNRYISVDLSQSWNEQYGKYAAQYEKYLALYVNISYITQPLPQAPQEFKKNGQPKKMPPFDGAPHTIRETRPLKKHSPKQVAQINFDINRLPLSEDRLFLESAVYLINGAPYESNATLFKIVRQKKITSDPILSAYYTGQVERNRLKE